MKNIFSISLTLCCFLSFAQQDVTKTSTSKSSSIFDNVSLSLDVNLLNAMHVNEILEQDLTSYVFKIQKKLNFNDNFSADFSLGYAFDFKYIPLELGLSYNLFKNLNANLGCGLYSIVDDRWTSTTMGLDDEDPSNNDFGIYFGLHYMLNDKFGLQVNYNSIESEEEDIEISSMSLNGTSFGVSYKL